MSASRLQPCGDLVHQRVAQPGMLDALDRLTDEGLDQQRLGFLRRNAARLEIEQKVIVERAGGRAMATLHIVSVDFQLRLAIGLGVLGQAQRMRAILASVFCALGATVMRPWKTLRLSPSSTDLKISRLVQARPM